MSVFRIFSVKTAFPVRDSALPCVHCEKFFMRELLMKYITGDISPEEKEKVIGWIYGAEENMQEYIRLRRLYDISLWNGTEALVRKERPAARIFRGVLKYAAVAAVCILSAGLYFYSGKGIPGETTVRTSDGQSAELLLPDSSKVWLGPNSSLTFTDSFSGKERNVSMEGMAYFDVRHAGNKPFKVSAGVYNVKVLGTEFSVMSHKESGYFETMLLKGKVEVSDSLSSRITLLPNERLYSVCGNPVKERFFPAEYDKLREGMFSISNEAFKSLIPKIEVCYGITLDVRNEDLLDKCYSGNFPISEGIEHMLKTLQLDCDFTYSFNGSGDTIYIR